MGHMNWDTTMPGQLGYMATMLYNPNNVANEASPATTRLETLAGRALCNMLFNAKEKADIPGELAPAKYDLSGLRYTG